MNVGDLIRLKIDRLSYDGGRGVGRFENFVFFVANTAPQDEVQATIIEIKKNFGVAKLKNIIAPGPSRRVAPCPVFGRCGGCVWQHVNYEEQINQKRNLLTHALKKYLPAAPAPIEIISSPKEFRYRNRIQLQVSSSSKIGFFAAGSNEIVEIDDCLIADERLMSGLDRQSNEFKNGKKVEVAIDEAGQRVVRNLSEEESVFTQVNSAQNENLKGLVIAFAKLGVDNNKCENLIDLYCGDGNLSFALLAALPEVKLVGIESSTAAVKRAQGKNVFNHRAKFQSFDVENYLSNVKKIEPKTLFVVDPPRAGLGAKVCSEIRRLQPTRLIYVSCNLATLARDLAVLVENYEISQVKGLDMFPQTEYLETVVSLVLRGN